MKKLASIIVLVFAFTVTVQAQRDNKKENHEKLSVDQRTDLMVKKMALKLDLTAEQQNKIRPLIAEKAAKRNALHEKRKAMKKAGEKRKKMSADERYKIQNARLDEMIAFKGEMKNILNEKQYEKYEKMQDRKMMKAKKKMKKRKGRKGKKEHKEDNKD